VGISCNFSRAAFVRYAIGRNAAAERQRVRCRAEEARADRAARAPPDPHATTLMLLFSHLPVWRDTTRWDARSPEIRRGTLHVQASS